MTAPHARQPQVLPRPACTPAAIRAVLAANADDEVLRQSSRLRRPRWSRVLSSVTRPDAALAVMDGRVHGPVLHVQRRQERGPRRARA